MDAPLEAKFLSVAQFDLSNQAVNHEHRSTIEIFDDLLDFSEVFRCGTDNDTVTFGFRDHDDFPTEGNTDRIAAVLGTELDDGAECGAARNYETSLVLSLMMLDK